MVILFFSGLRADLNKGGKNRETCYLFFLAQKKILSSILFPDFVAGSLNFL